MDKYDKNNRVLGIYTKLLNGSVINKTQEAQQYGVSEKSIQRDIDDIRSFLEDNPENTGIDNCLYYDRAVKGYRLEQSSQVKFHNSEIFAVSKILLDSRAFTKKEMQKILDKLIGCCAPKSNQKLMEELIKNEAFHYVEPRHKTAFLDRMWEIGQAIHHCNYMEITYYRMEDQTCVKRRVKPVAILFSEFYFYLTAFIDNEETRKNVEVKDDTCPMIYRIDQIREWQVLNEHFYIPYKDRIEEREFRKRMQFMQGGWLRRVEFKYAGTCVEAVLDRLPTARILNEEDGVYSIRAEVFGKGIEMWIRGQGDLISDVRYR